MSGKATGWVLKNYPITKPADRNRKLTFIGIADSANQFGQHACPGLEVLCEEWAFDPQTVKRHIRELVAAGWLVVDQPATKGRWAVYSIPGMLLQRATESETTPDEILFQSPPDSVTKLSDSGSAHLYPLDGRDDGRDRGASAPQAPEFDGMPKKPKSRVLTDPIVAAADAITKGIFERRERKPIASFLNVRGLAEAALRANWSQREIEDVMMHPQTVFTKAGLETARTKMTNGGGRGRRNDPDAESLMITRIANPGRYEERLQQEEQKRR